VNRRKESPDGLLVNVTRGGLVESVHRVFACAVDGDGNVIYGAGDIEMPVYLRSTAKPLIAAAIIEAGAGKRFGLDSQEVAVIAASHSGEPYHVQAVQSILDKIGMTASALQCGVHAPYDERAAEDLRRAGKEPSVLHNNCSGKHAGILALCRSIGADTATYLQVDNPAQQRILEFCARLSDDDASSWPLGVDGCGIPVYATSLRKAALSFARLATLRGVTTSDAKALEVVRDAMAAHPEYVSGTGQFDTELMRAAGGKLVAKAGAEGLQGVGSPGLGFGYASKVLDGSPRGRGPITIAAMRRLGVLSEEQASHLERFARPTVYNRAGRAVGEVVV
jgi:L-asparaginase II